MPELSGTVIGGFLLDSAPAGPATATSSNPDSTTTSARRTRPVNHLDASSGAFGLPVVGLVTDTPVGAASVLERGAGRSRRLDEPPQLARVLATAAGRGLDAGRDVDAPGPDAPDRLGDVVGREPTGEQQTNAVQRAADLAPVEHAARARVGRIEEDDVGGTLGGH